MKGFQVFSHGIQFLLVVHKGLIEVGARCCVRQPQPQYLAGCSRANGPSMPQPVTVVSC